MKATRRILEDNPNERVSGARRLYSFMFETFLKTSRGFGERTVFPGAIMIKDIFTLLITTVKAIHLVARGSEPVLLDPKPDTHGTL